MLALFHHVSIIDHINPIRAQDGTQAVRNHNRGAVLQQTLQRLLNEQLGDGIYTGGCFIQKQNT